MEHHIDVCQIYSAYNDFMKFIEKRDISNL